MPTLPTTAFSPRVTRREIALVGGLVLVGIVGAWMATRQLGELRAELASLRQSSSGEIARLRADNAQLRENEKARELVRVSGPVAAPASPSTELAPVSRADRMAALLAWARITTRGSGGNVFRVQQLMRTMGSSTPAISGPAYIVGPSLELPPRFGELFGLSADQVAQLQHALDLAGAGLDERVAANTEVRDNGDGTYTLEVRAVPESVIAPDRARMIAAFREVLGEDGYQAFVLLNGESEDPGIVSRGGINQFFNNYGTVSRTATISRTASGYRYEMRFGQSGSASGGGPSRDALKATVGAGIKLLPPGF